MKKILIVLLLLVNLCSCKVDNAKESNLYGVDTFVFEEYNFPQVFGKPSIKNNDLATYLDLNNEALYQDINSYIDLLRINSLKDYSERFTYYDAYNWAKKHYDQVGAVIAKRLTEFNDFDYFTLIYIVDNNQYYLFDISSDTNSKEWLKYYKGDNAIITSEKELEQLLLYNYPIKFFDIHIIEPENVVVFPNKTISYIETNRGTECYSYFTYDLPVALGIPVLNDKQIKELANSNDYKKIRESINNIGDAVAFIDELNIRVQTDYESRSYNGGFSVDYGNNWYYNEQNVVYSCSGSEIIKLRVAQCSAMATLINFLLYDDFDELGYITGREHAINYLKGNDNRYYLCDASGINGNKRWLLGITKEISSDTLEGAIKNYIDAGYTPYTDETNFMFSWEYDGVWTFKEEIENNTRILMFPNGTKNVNIWLENMSTIISYYEPLNHTDHYYFIFENKDKN